MNRKYIVTGANGFLGSALAARLHRDGASVRGICRHEAELGFPVAVLPSLDDREIVLQQLNDVDVVIHCAARVHVMRDAAHDPLAEFRSVNRDITASLARLAAEAGVRRFVFLSSIKVNGESTARARPFRPDDPVQPVDPYGVSKKEAEEVLRTIGRETDMEIVIIRPPLVYGPGVKGNFHNLLKLVDSSLPLPLRAIKNTRSMIYLGNLVDFIIQSSTNVHAANETFLISDRHDLSTGELIAMIRSAMGRPARLLAVPTALFKFAGLLTGKSAAINRLISSLQLDSSKAGNLLNWEPPFTVEQGIVATVKHFRAGSV